MPVAPTDPCPSIDSILYETLVALLEEALEIVADPEAIKRFPALRGCFKDGIAIARTLEILASDRTEQ